MTPITLVDQAARDAIRDDLAATLVVEAAAGTGKTTAMIARILTAIRSGATTLERIVAVTFTEKAAGEMKLRLRTELERARQAAEGIERSRLEGSLAELEIARVGSIHSFCADVLRERPIEARVDPLFEVAAEDETERIYEQAFEAWLQGALGDPGEGVRRMLRRTEPTDLLRMAGIDLVNRRDFDGTWRRDPFAREAAIDHVVAELAVLGALAARADSPRDPLADLCGSLDRWVRELGRREHVRARDYDALEAELVAVAKWWQWKVSGRSKWFGANLPRADVVAQRDLVRVDLVNFLDAASADLAACLREELRPLVAGYERLVARSGKLDFLDLLVRTRDLLRDDATVRAQMQARFTHYFIDEFQDTDPLQVEILMLLCADDAAERDPAAVRVQPGKLFVVGDPKQAIYRFRRADITLYEGVKVRLLGQGARLVHLTTSFRGVASIQAAINAAFEPVMRGDGQADYVRLENCRADRAGQAQVIALPVPEPYGRGGKITGYAIDESYPAAVAGLVDWLITRSGWRVGDGDGTPVAARHVCLMFRRFQSFGHDLTRRYVRALEARGVPHVLVGGRSLHAREESEAIRNALAAIEWPDDEMSVYATLRGPLFAFHDEDLVAFRHAHQRLHPLAWRDAERIAALASEAGREVAGALAILGDLNARRNRRPIADTLARLLAATRAHAGLAVWPAGEQALANVLRVIDLARRFEANGASSFRAFVERLTADAERGGRHADAIVVEDGTEGVRIMTVHAAKGLEFPVVILCDPTAPLESEHPSRYIDVARRAWYEPLARCVPIELHDHAEEVKRRDREEIERLAYVAVTRARDVLVVPVVGDDERGSWLGALLPVVYPAAGTWRRAEAAAGCPAFGGDSVVERPFEKAAMATSCVAPGAHVPRAGAHRVVWWDPNVLGLGVAIAGGLRQRQILQADDGGTNVAASERAHADWQARRAAAIAAGSLPSLVVRSVTTAAAAASSSSAMAAQTPVHVVDTGLDRSSRPGGRRFGSLVHAILASIDLRCRASELRVVATSHARYLGAPDEELAAAIRAVAAALRHPVLERAARAADRGELRREVPVVLRDDAGALVEGIVDLAFADDGGWIVIDFKTDANLDRSLAAYEAQVQLYARAIGEATGKPVTAALMVV